MSSVVLKINLSIEIVEKVLRNLENDGLIVRGDFSGQGNEEWCHTAILDRIRRKTMELSRGFVSSRKIDCYCQFLSYWQGVGKDTVSGHEDLYEVITMLKGLYLPVDWWEDFVFPSKIQGYKKAYPDRLCSSGRIMWRINTGNNTIKLAWYTPDDADDSKVDVDISSLSKDELKVYSILTKKGACFLHSLSASAIETGDFLNAIESLVWKGIIVNDSFESIRYFMNENGMTPKVRARRRASAYKMDMGRWEIASKIKERDIEGEITLLMNRYGLLSREMLQYERLIYSWSQVYEVLKQWEYIGEVNRGYYIEGLSGMQFILPGTEKALDLEHKAYIVLDACDPAQAYGRIASRAEDEDTWTGIPGNAVVMKNGKIVLLIEGYGERFSPVTCDIQVIRDAVKELLSCFRNGCIWSGQKRIVMKKWEDDVPSRSGHTDIFNEAGFEREMQYMVLWK